MTDENALKLGRAVATLRERIGLSQKELAQRAGITPSHLSRIESGDRMPGKEIIARLAEALYTPGLFLVAGLLVPEEIKSKYNLSDFTVPDIFPGDVRQPAEPLKSVCDVLLANMGLLFEETKRLQEKIKGLEIAAEAIQKKYVLSSKPNPSSVAVPVLDKESLREELRTILDACRRNDCSCDIVLKDISTCCRRPQNIFEWEQTAMELVRNF